MPASNAPAPLADALDAITDPVTGAGLLASRRAAAHKLRDGQASVILDVSGLSSEARSKLETEVQARLIALPGVDAVHVAMTSERAPRRSIAIASGKGGVGKSTLAANLAVALARAGLKVGLIDADIHGPSQPRLMGAEDKRPTARDKRLNPVLTVFGVPMLSIGQMIEPGRAIAWRGPLAAGALGQLIDADWGETELLIIDMPPGTGDVQLTMIQKHRPDGALIVSTPQDLAMIDATRAIDLYAQARIPVIGLIENMAGYHCPHCGKPSDPFGNGGAEESAATLGIPFLGRVPLSIAVRAASDAGTPPAAGNGSEAEPFIALARKLSDWLTSAR